MKQTAALLVKTIYLNLDTEKEKNRFGTAVRVHVIPDVNLISLIIKPFELIRVALLLFRSS